MIFQLQSHYFIPACEAAVILACASGCNVQINQRSAGRFNCTKFH